jgi:hypothetical protein
MSHRRMELEASRDVDQGNNCHSHAQSLVPKDDASMAIQACRLLMPRCIGSEAIGVFWRISLGWPAVEVASRFILGSHLDEMASWSILCRPKPVRVGELGPCSVWTETLRFCNKIRRHGPHLSLVQMTVKTNRLLLVSRNDP